MPIYEYRCPNGHLVELFHRMDEPPPGACEVCGASPMEKVLHPVPVFFKGKGFYATDYGRGKRKRDAGDSDASKADEGGKKPEKPEKTEAKKPEPA